MKKVALTQGLRRGDTTIDEIEVFRPNVMSLKGLKLIEVLSADVNAIGVLLPRITSPSLSKAEVQALDVTDFVELTTAVLSFFNNKDETETMYA
ncbi:phage tail assembly protein [Gallibacterium anatis]|uniref:phage tail assembly protein n=1 Tax=Gallibacterium anatis TaxID=750 RepID=UPI0039FDD2D7